MPSQQLASKKSRIVGAIGKTLFDPRFQAITGAIEYMALRPSVVLHNIPLFFVDRCEVSSSHDIQKERSIGQIFFAQQQGAYFVITVHGYLTGPFKWARLTALEALHYGGKSYATDYEEDGNTVNMSIPDFDDYMKGKDIGRLSVEKTEIIQERKTITKEHNMDKMNRQGNEVQFTDPDAKRNTNHLAIYFTRRSFPVITPDGIFSRMYVKTINYQRDANINGLDAIEYTIILERVQKPPPIYRVWTGKTPEKRMKAIDVQIARARSDQVKAKRRLRKARVPTGPGGVSNTAINARQKAVKDLADARQHAGEWLQRKAVYQYFDTHTDTQVRMHGRVWQRSQAFGPNEPINQFQPIRERGRQTLPSLDYSDIMVNGLYRGVLSALDNISTFADYGRWPIWHDAYTDPLVGTAIRTYTNPTLPKRSTLIGGALRRSMSKNRGDFVVDAVGATANTFTNARTPEFTVGSTSPLIAAQAVTGLLRNPETSELQTPSTLLREGEEFSMPITQVSRFIHADTGAAINLEPVVNEEGDYDKFKTTTIVYFQIDKDKAIFKVARGNNKYSNYEAKMVDRRILFTHTDSGKDWAFEGNGRWCHTIVNIQDGETMVKYLYITISNCQYYDDDGPLKKATIELFTTNESGLFDNVSR